ncbi:hypothetical protein LIS82_21460 [Cytobacillus solani]|uniref:Uncharacterized protein n=1 Tax=Cytobacillus solani TaxID=1637975 RepID=A0A0Q3QTM2_9BACI|nr:hypothetical protein [Cytobacillus solani]KOP83819.1 hypothetical protein AMS60_15745 [Bacillus sp. FJAT-21945]KQL20896.1 hypothetical protein AN957_21370 [Cytobacillus solani]USK54140.1 hypothetical protein LIS82_21460 [Cytobacillus solani]
MPPFHPDWLVNFWLGTPFLNMFDPHAVLIFLIVVTVMIVFIQRKNHTYKQEFAADENQFQLLLKKKSVIEDQMALLDKQKMQGEIGEDQYINRKNEYELHLNNVKSELIRFT